MGKLQLHNRFGNYPANSKTRDNSTDHSKKNEWAYNGVIFQNIKDGKERATFWQSELKVNLLIWRLCGIWTMKKTKKLAFAEKRRIILQSSDSVENWKSRTL